MLEAAASGCVGAIHLLAEVGGVDVNETVNEETGDHALLEAAAKGGRGAGHWVVHSWNKAYRGTAGQVSGR